MKKLLTALFIAGAMALTGCKPDILKSDSAKSKLTSNGYKVEVYAEAEAKVRIQGLDYEGVSFKDALVADKGTGDDKDVLLVFYFAGIKEAESFMSINIAKMNGFLEANLGSKLQSRVGTHNNIAYAGSETSFSVAF